MTKKEYMKKLAYQLRRLPKEDFDKEMCIRDSSNCQRSNSPNYYDWPTD